MVAVLVSPEDGADGLVRLLRGAKPPTGTGSGRVPRGRGHGHVPGPPAHDVRPAGGLDPDPDPVGQHGEHPHADVGAGQDEALPGRHENRSMAGSLLGTSSQSPDSEAGAVPVRFMGHSPPMQSR
jgi:hypothetical protein